MQSNKEQSDTQLPAVEFNELGATVLVFIRTNFEKHVTPAEEGESRVWFTDDLTTLELSAAELTDELRQQIIADPEKFTSYVPEAERMEMQQKYTDAIQKWMDATAHTRGYDNIFSAISYADSTVAKFREEGNACRVWRDNVWTAAYAYLDDVLTGKKPLVPVEELISHLPQIDW